MNDVLSLKNIIRSDRTYFVLIFYLIHLGSYLLKISNKLHAFYAQSFVFGHLKSEN